MNPFSLDPTYAPVLTPEELKLMEVETSQELLLLCALRRGEPVSESTVNMKCPVVINDQSRRAVQVIGAERLYHAPPFGELSQWGCGIMLVLRRKAGDGFAVGDSVNITILGVDPSGTVSIGIDAPRDVLILRSELQEAANANRDSAEDVASLQTVERLESIFSLGGAKEAHRRSRNKNGKTPKGGVFCGYDEQELPPQPCPLSAAKLSVDYSTAVTKKAMDSQEAAVQRLLEIFAGGDLPMGKYIDTYA